jgi:hypothetical protein
VRKTAAVEAAQPSMVLGNRKRNRNGRDRDQHEQGE